MAKLDIEVARMELIGSGSDGPVYRISDDKVAKFEWAGGLGVPGGFFAVSPIGKRIQNESEVCKFLYENGVSVPKPYGIFRIKQPRGEMWSAIGVPRRFPAFVMEYLDAGGPRPENISELVEKERQKAITLGFKLHDAGYSDNTLWVPNRQKVYLIDFSKWQLPGRTK